MAEMSHEEWWDKTRLGRWTKQEALYHYRANSAKWAQELIEMRHGLGPGGLVAVIEHCPGGAFPPTLIQDAIEK